MDGRISLPWRIRGLQTAAAFILAACGGGGSGGGGSFPSMSEMSAPQPVLQARSCAFSQAQVQVDEIRIRRSGANDITATLPEPRPIDLLDPGTGILEALQLAPLTSDALDVRLSVAGGSTVTLEDGTVAPLRVPRNLRLSGDFRLAAGMVADLVVQGVDRCDLIHAAGQSGQFVLNGQVPAMVRALPFVTDREQAIGGTLRPVPGNGYATVGSSAEGNSFTIQRFDAYGAMLGGAFNISLPDNALSPEVTPLANGVVLATWLGPATDPEVPLGNHFPLMMQRFGADGSALGPSVQVALSTPFISRVNPPNNAQVAALADGGAALVWVQVEAGNLNLYLERFAADGSTVFGPQRVNVNGEGFLPNVVGLTGGRVLVAWGAGQLSARVFQSDGSAGAQQLIAPAALSVFGPPQLAALTNGGASVVWTGLLDGRFELLTRVILAPDATPISPQQFFADGEQPSIAGLADGGFVVAWFTLRNVVTQRFGPDGTPLGPSTRLNPTITTVAAGPSVVALPWGGFLIGWPVLNDAEVMRFFDAQGLLGT